MIRIRAMLVLSLASLSWLASGLIVEPTAFAQGEPAQGPDAPQDDAPPDDAPQDEASPDEAPPDDAPQVPAEAPQAPQAEAPPAPAEAPQAPEAPAPAPQAAPQAPAQAEAPAPGTLRGTVRAKETGEPVPGATVVLLGTSLATLSELDGTYVITDVPPGSYQVEVAAASTATAMVDVAPGTTTDLDLTIEESAFAGEVVIVTGTRSPEKIFDAPVTVESITAQDLDQSGGTTYLSALADIKGVDFSTLGINEHRVSARGFDTQFNSRMLSMVDGRMAQLPGSGLPQNNMVPSTPLDVKAVEVVIGPASALYGANAHTGVVNVITKTPWDESGAAVSVRGGMRSLIDVATRVAGTVNETFGWKLGAQFLRANDFEPDPDLELHRYGTTIPENDLVEDYQVGALKLDGSLYYRLGDWFTKASYGFSENDSFSPTNLGRNHIRDWRVQYQTLQVSHPNWYAQVSRTASDAGGTYQLNGLAGIAQQRKDDGLDYSPDALDPFRDDIRFIDKSQMMDSELQYRDTFAGINTAVGAQWRLYLPNSEGSYLADAGGEDIDATELGGYVQADYTTLNDRLRLVAAARVDDHSNYSTQLSPKASAVYTVTPSHKVRAGYNRAFKSPTILENYLLIGGFLLGNRDGYTIRDADGNVLTTVDPLEPEGVHSVELGYKGALGRRVFIDAVIHNSWYENFISPLTQVASPADGTYGYDADGNQIGDGTLFTYQNFGAAVVRGADVGLSYYPNDTLTLSTSASVIELAEFTRDDEMQADLLLNVPTFKLKGSLTVQNLGMDDYFVRLEGRYRTAFPFKSGYWNSEVLLLDDGGEVPARFTADITAGYDFPDQGLAIRGHVMNIFNDKTMDMLGAPVTGTLAYLQLIYTYQGLTF